MGKNDYEENHTPMTAQGEKLAYLSTQDMKYEQGDSIRITTDSPGRHLAVRLDEALDTTLIYLSGTTWEYAVPLAENERSSIPDIAFTGKGHYISVRYARDYEIKQYRNLAYNPHDQKEASGAYPHAHANVETRNDSTFFAKNAIDGIYANNSHGSYPYQSWGINRNPEAQLTIDFGRKVCIDGVGLVLRADFPHDSYWQQVTLRFSDGTSHTFDTAKTADIQEFSFAPITAEFVVLEKLIKADDESPFPALSQLEVYGTEKGDGAR